MNYDRKKWWNDDVAIMVIWPMVFGFLFVALLVIGGARPSRDAAIRVECVRGCR